MHSIPELISYVSSFTTLLPGDVILTGTPAGIGAMVAGDSVSVTISGIGTLIFQSVVSQRIEPSSAETPATPPLPQ